MKRLILLRHAKAVSKQGARDFDRALADQGRAEMASVARFLGATEPPPDLALVSSARRTRETWDLARAGLEDVATAYEERIYEASPEGLLAVLREADGVTADGPDETVVLVGHNPGISDLAQMLVGPADGGRAQLASGMPTAGIVIIDFDIEAWATMNEGTGRLAQVQNPSPAKAG
jgi:phosphohistidine phosphatase